MIKRLKPLFIILGVIILLFSIVAVLFSVNRIKTKRIDNEYSYLFSESKLESIKIENVPLIKQDVSCGYAIIEMLSDFYGSKTTEKDLYERNNHKVSTQSTKGFVKEINKTIPNKSYEAFEYLKNDELLIKINKSLKKGNPVAVEWAAKLEDTWTIHWSIVTGMDKDHIYINNPYGYKEVLTYSEFISRTTFKAFEKMPLLYSFGFALGLFSKNTIIIAK